MSFKKYLPLLLLSASVGSLHAEYCYRLQLDGKPDSQQFPLSQRALERRERLGIALDSTDLEVSPLYQQQLTEAGLKILCRSRWLNSVVVTRPGKRTIPDSVFQSFPFVKSFEPVTTTHRSNVTPKFRTEDNLLKDEAETDGYMPDNCTTPLRELKAYTSLYMAGHRGKGKLIALLDGGYKNIDRYPWLMDKVRGFCDMYNPLDSVTLFREETHGACCYSIMGSDKEHGVLGSAQEADYYLIRTEDNYNEVPLEEDMWVAGAELADSIGADLISSSLGYYEFDAPFAPHTHAQLTTDEVWVSRGAEVACRKGMLVCLAAGNEADNSWKRIIFPSNVEEVLTVGATTPSLEPAYFTSHGFTTPYVKPDVSCRGMYCYTVDADTNDGRPSDTGAGTSYATPLMAGLCASLWSAVPELTPSELKQVVRESGNQAAAPDSILGYGMPDFSIALEKALLLHPTTDAISTITPDDERTEARPAVTTYNLFGLPSRRQDDGMFYIENGKVQVRRRR